MACTIKWASIVLLQLPFMLLWGLFLFCSSGWTSDKNTWSNNSLTQTGQQGSAVWWPDSMQGQVEFSLISLNPCLFIYLVIRVVVIIIPLLPVNVHDHIFLGYDLWTVFWSKTNLAEGQYKILSCLTQTLFMYDKWRLGCGSLDTVEDIGRLSIDPWRHTE